MAAELVFYLVIMQGVSLKKSNPSGEIWRREINDNDLAIWYDESHLHVFPEYQVKYIICIVLGKLNMLSFNKY